MRKFLKIYLIITLLLPALISYGREDFEIIDSALVTLQYHSNLSGTAEYVIEIFPSVLITIRHKLGFSTDFKPRIIILRDSRDFQDFFRGDLYSAVAIPAGDLIIIDNSKMLRDRFTLRMTLIHEMSHLVLHRYIGTENLPRWLDEGISQWVSDGISELAADPGWSVFENAVLRDKLFSLNDLSTFPTDRGEIALAYKQSKSFTEYLINIYGEKSIVDLLRVMRKGVPVETAFQEVYLRSLNQIERDWKAGLEAQVSWYTYVSRNLFQLLFIAGAVLLIIAFIKRIIEKRNYKDDEEEYYSP